MARGIEIQFGRDDSPDNRLEKLRRLAQTVEELSRLQEQQAAASSGGGSSITMTGPALLGRISGSGTPDSLPGDQAVTLLPPFSPAAKGLVPASGSATGLRFLRDDGGWATISLGSGAFANPTTLIGLTAVNGTALTAMRSDAAPALDQSIAPVWTGTHTFTQAARFADGAAGTPSITFTSDLDTGVFHSGADELSIATGGVQQWYVDSTGRLRSSPNITIPAPVLASDPTLVIARNAQQSIALVSAGTGISLGYRFVSAGGTIAAPTAVTTADVTYMSFLGAGGYDGTTWQVGSAALIGIRPNATWSGTSRATRLTFETTVDTSVTRKLRAEIFGSVAEATELRLVSGRTDDIGGVFLRFVEDDNSTTKGFVGFTSTSDNDLDIINSETDANIILTTTGTGQVLFPPGAIATPGLAFSNDTNTGFYRNAADSVQIVCGGVDLFSAQLSGTTRIVRMGDGAGNGGEFHFRGAAGTQRGFLFYTGTTSLRWVFRANATAEGGADAGSDLEIVKVSDAAAATTVWRIMRVDGQVRQADGSNTLPIMSFINDTDTGFYRSGSNEVSFASAGTQNIVFSNVALGLRSAIPLQFNNAANDASVTMANTGGAGARRLATTMASTERLAVLLDAVLGRDGAVGNPAWSFISDPDTGMWDAGANLLAFSTAGVEAARISASQELLLGHTAAIAGILAGTAITPALQRTGITAAGSAALISRWTADANGSLAQLGKSRGATAGTFTVVQSGDTLAMWSAVGADGTDFAEAARMQVVVDGTPGANDMPGRWEFLTSADGTQSPTVRLTITQDGRIFGGALHNNAGAVTGATNQYIASGTYTPTLTSVTNVAASTSRLATWSRVGNKVHVSGQIDVDPTAAGQVQIGISLPIASALTTAFQLGGVGAMKAVAGVSTAIEADATNDRAQMEWVAVDTANRTIAYEFGYEVL